MKTDIPTKPWEIMGFAKDLFGLPFMRRLIGVNSDRQVYRQCTNPNMNYGDEPCPSFIERTAMLIVELKHTGRPDANDAIVGTLQYLAGLVGYDVVKHGEHLPDKDTLPAEMRDDLNKYFIWYEAMEAEAPPSVCDVHYSHLLDELRQTKTRHKIDYFKKHKGKRHAA